MKSGSSSGSQLPPFAVAVGIKAFSGLRKPQAKALLPDDFDQRRQRLLRKLLVDGWK
jgi:hypothetical protein